MIAPDVQPALREHLKSAVVASFVGSFRVAILIGAGLAVCSAVSAAVQVEGETAHAEQEEAGTQPMRDGRRPRQKRSRVMRRAETGTSTWAPLRNGVFRALWLASLVSNIGIWMQTVGAQWLLVQKNRPRPSPRRRRRRRTCLPSRPISGRDACPAPGVSLSRRQRHPGPRG